MGFHTMKAETQDSGKLLLSSEWNLASLQWFCCLNYCFKHLVLKSIRFGISIGTKMFGMKPNFRWETRGPSCVWNSDEWIHQLGCFPFRNSSNLLLAGRLLSSTSGQANSKKLSERQKCCAQRKDSLWTGLWENFSSALPATYFIQTAGGPAASRSSTAYVTTGGLNGNYISSSDTGTLTAHTPEKWTWQQLPQFQEWADEEEEEEEE